MSLIDIDNIEVSPFNEIINNMNWNTFINCDMLNKLYYISNNKINKNINFSNQLGG